MRTIRIGTRESELALWQTNHVASLLSAQGISVEVVPIKSQGDIDLISPLYEMGVQGVFTKTLDAAQLAGQIDLAVHSLKDVPTQPAKGLEISAVLEREDFRDLLVLKNLSDAPTEEVPFTLATGSVRRKAMWLNKFPKHQVIPLRGNINTRLQKLQDDDSCSGALFALAGVKRINLAIPHGIPQDWMLPAPAQGAIAVACRADDEEMKALLAQINHKESQLCTHVEKMFLRTLEGGCSTPIGTLAQINNQKIHFRGVVLSPDGLQKIEVEGEYELDHPQIGEVMASEALKLGAKELL